MGGEGGGVGFFVVVVVVFLRVCFSCFFVCFVLFCFCFCFVLFLAFFGGVFKASYVFFTPTLEYESKYWQRQSLSVAAKRLSVPQNEVLCCTSTNLLRIRLGKNKNSKRKKSNSSMTSTQQDNVVI